MRLAHVILSVHIFSFLTRLSRIVSYLSDNKITQKNAWNLKLTDVLPDLLIENEPETNFQKAGCTLDARSIFVLLCDCVFVCSTNSHVGKQPVNAPAE